MCGMVPDRVVDGKVITSKAGKVCPPLFYDNQWVVGIKAFEKEISDEVSRARSMVRLCGGPGLSYPDEPGALELDAAGVPKWRVKVIRVVNGRSKDPKRCITDLIDYTIWGSKQLYAGTVMEGKEMIYGDALSTWYEHGAELPQGEVSGIFSSVHPTCRIISCRRLCGALGTCWKLTRKLRA